jgi:NADH-quinone oxidoreductase subunit K
MELTSLFSFAGVTLAESAGPAVQAAAAAIAEPAFFTLRNCLILGTMLFIIGAWGVLVRRNVLIVLISVELMLNAVNLVFASFARAHANLEHTPGAHAGETGQIFALFIIAIAAAEAAVGLAIVLTWFNNKESVDTRDMNLLKN